MSANTEQVSSLVVVNLMLSLLILVAFAYRLGGAGGVVVMVAIIILATNTIWNLLERRADVKVQIIIKPVDKDVKS